jgi:hypothetical protein
VSRRGKLQKFADRLGVPGVVGVGLLMFAATYFAGASMPARERLLDLQRELTDARRASVPEPRRGGDPDSDLAAFYTFFAPSASVPDALKGINVAVIASGLAFEAAEYRLAREGTLKLARYEVTVPLRGTYAQVRNFVAALLQQMPQVAIDDVVIKRESVDAAQIEARLRLSIYLNLP